MANSIGVKVVVAVAVVVVMVCGQTQAQTGCNNVVLSLAPCLGYISGATDSPSQPCCTQLASVVESQPQCLCSIAQGGSSPVGISINQTRALWLPQACNIRTPPVSQCNVVGGTPYYYAPPPPYYYVPGDARGIPVTSGHSNLRSVTKGNNVVYLMIVSFVLSFNNHLLF